MNTDITYCTRDCANTECLINKVQIYEGKKSILLATNYQIDKEQEYVWQSDFEGCEVYKDANKG